MVGLPNFRSHLKYRPFANLPLLNHSKSGHVQISDPHCIAFKIKTYDAWSRSVHLQQHLYM